MLPDTAAALQDVGGASVQIAPAEQGSNGVQHGQQQQITQQDKASQGSGHAGPQEQQAPQQCLQELCSSLLELQSTCDSLVAWAHSNSSSSAGANSAAGTQSAQPADDPYRDSSTQARSTTGAHNSSDSSSSSSQLVDELQQQLAALSAEKQRIEADRQEMAVQQGCYKGTTAKVGMQDEGRLQAG